MNNIIQMGLHTPYKQNLLGSSTKHCRNIRTTYESRFFVGVGNGRLMFGYVSMVEPDVLRVSQKDPSKMTNNFIRYAIDTQKLVPCTISTEHQRTALQLGLYPQNQHGSGSKFQEGTVFGLHPALVHSIEQLSNLGDIEESFAELIK